MGFLFTISNFRLFISQLPKLAEAAYLCCNAIWKYRLMYRLLVEYLDPTRIERITKVN